MKIYISEVVYGTPRLSEVEAEERPKSFKAFPSTAKRLIGDYHYIGTFYKKSEVFLDRTSALHYINGKLLEEILDMEEKIRKKQEHKLAIEKMLESE